MGHHAIDGVEIFLRFIVQFLGLGFQLLEAPLGIYVDCIFRVLSKIEFRFELLGRLPWCQSLCDNPAMLLWLAYSDDALLKALEGHLLLYGGSK